MASAGPHQAAAFVDTSVPPEERYDIVGRIAAGGMAEIYLARMFTPSGTEREVVLKRLMPELQNDQEFVQMFYDEANIASQLNHPNIVQIFELGELDGSMFIAMELLRGVNLRDLLARLHVQNQSIPTHLGVRVACSALDALDYAHRFSDANGRPLNVVHRDVSPQNIIVTFEGIVKLVDFGVAKAEGRLHQTRAGLIKGKFAYMSPEQVGGGKLDGRSDLFALTEVFYELLLKRHPFYATSDMEVLRAILDKDPPHPTALDSNFPPGLGEIFVKALRKAPGDRFASAGQMHDALEKFLQENHTPATTEMLGDYMASLFADRVEQEKHARAHDDDDALVEALTAGRAEDVGAGQSRSQASAPIPSMVSDDGDPSMPEDYESGDHRVVEISRSPEPVVDPADAGAPAFMAHSGHTNPSISRRRFSSQVRDLFDEPDDPEPQEPSDLDEGEMPTMLGMLSAEEMAALRHNAAAAREQKFSPGITVAPAQVSQRPDSHNIKVQPIDPAEHVPRKIRMQPPSVSNSNISVSQASIPVTHRSQTVLGADPPPASNDKLGLLFFIAGLGALIGAVIYAAWLYTSGQGSGVDLELSTTPAGATVLLNGADTGAVTPHSFRNLSSDQAHEIVFRLKGYEDCRRSVPAGTEAVARVICTLKELDD